MNCWRSGALTKGDGHGASRYEGSACCAHVLDSGQGARAKQALSVMCFDACRDRDGAGCGVFVLRRFPLFFQGFWTSGGRLWHMAQMDSLRELCGASCVDLWIPQALYALACRGCMLWQKGDVVWARAWICMFPVRGLGADVKGEGRCLLKSVLLCSVFRFLKSGWAMGLVQHWSMVTCVLRFMCAAQVLVSWL